LFEGDWWFHRFSDAERRIDVRFIFGDRAVFEAALEDYMNENRHMNQEQLLWRVLVVSDLEAHLHYVSVFMFHCISDGYSRMKLCADLIQQLDVVSKGGATDYESIESVVKLPEPTIYDRLLRSSQWRRLPLWKRILPDIATGIIRMLTYSTKSNLPIDAEAPASVRISKALFKSTPEGLITRFHTVCKGKGVSVSAGLMAIYLAQLRDTYTLPTGFLIGMPY
jgi:hypothetical protein